MFWDRLELNESCICPCSLNIVHYNQADIPSKRLDFTKCVYTNTSCFASSFPNNSTDDLSQPQVANIKTTGCSIRHVFLNSWWHAACQANTLGEEATFWKMCSFMGCTTVQIQLIGWCIILLYNAMEHNNLDVFKVFVYKPPLDGDI